MKIGMELVAEDFNHALRLVLSHQSVIYMNAYELLPDGLDKKGGNNGGIYAAGKSKQDFPVSNLRESALPDPR